MSMRVLPRIELYVVQVCVSVLILPAVSQSPCMPPNSGSLSVSS